MTTYAIYGRCDAGSWTQSWTLDRLTADEARDALLSLVKGRGAYSAGTMMSSVLIDGELFQYKADPEGE